MRIKNLKISSKFNLFIVFLLSVLIIFITNFFELDLNYLGLISLICYLMFFLSWFVHYKIKLNFYSIFLAFTYLFYFGQFFLLIFGIPMSSGRTIINNLLPFDSQIDTGRLIINCMIFLHLGVLISTSKINKFRFFEDNYQDPFYIKDKNNIVFKKVALFMFGISIGPSLLILFNNVRTTYLYGYGAIFKSNYYTLGGFNSILRFISLFTIPSFIMLLILYKNNNKIKYINFFLVLYLGLYFLSGSRVDGVLILSALLLIKHFWYRPIKTKETIILFIVVLFGLTLLSIISEIRNTVYTTDNFGNLLLKTLQNILVKNPLFTSMEEAGFTFLTTATVFAFTPSVVAFQKGASYINGILMLVPNFFWDVHPAALVNTDITFKGFLTSYGGIGSSFIAEAYWNFGFGSIALSFVFGVLIGMLCNRIAKYSSQRNIKMFYLYIFIAQVILFYVRSDTVGFMRNLVYYGLFPLFLTNLLTKRNVKKVDEIEK